MKRNQNKYCKDNCRFLVHHCLIGGTCAATGNRLRDYDINAVLVKYIKDKNCPIEKEYEEKKT